MVKYVAMLLAVASLLVVADLAEAGRRRGGCPGGVCYTGGYSGGCPGGVCAVPVAPKAIEAAPAKGEVPAPPAPAAAAPAAQPAVAVATTQSAVRYTNTGRRWFNRR
jgi:hypothetical protein